MNDHRPKSPKRVLLIAAATASLELAASHAVAQESASQVVAASGTVIHPIVLAKDADLNFGTVVRPITGAGTVSIDATTGQRTLSGQGAVLNSGPAATRAVFTVSGEGGQTFSIAIPASMTMTRTGGSETVTATLVSSSAAGVLSNVLGGPGTASFGVGGQLPIDDGLVTGAYAGSFAVTVAYD